MVKQLTTKSSCTICQGKQMIRVVDGDDVRAKRCICLEAVLARRWLGNDEIFSAPLLKSKLYQPQEKEEVDETVDRTVEDLFLKGSWKLMCQHLRWCLIVKHHRQPEFTFKLIDDQRIVDVYVGNEAYKNKSAGERDYRESNNSLNDLVIVPDLLLLRLGVLRTYNKAAANAALQALTIRGAAGKPVWLVEGDKPFGDGHRAYNNELGEYIESRFNVIDLRDDTSQDLFKPASTIEIESVSMGGDDAPPQAHEFEVEPPAKERFKAQTAPKKAWGKKGRTSLPDMG